MPTRSLSSACVRGTQTCCLPRSRVKDILTISLGCYNSQKKTHVK